MDTNTNLLEVLQQSPFEIEGKFLWGSNYTFLAKVTTPQDALQAVYKPTRGERPLWDFPQASLARREVAAFWASQALEWELVPPTVYRRRGPLGAGSLQVYIEHDPEYHYFNFSPEDIQRLRPTAIFDLLLNNADRKGSHILVDPNRHIWLIDHGLCFHSEDKLRTVLWDFAGEAIPENLLADLERFKNELSLPAGSAGSSVSLLLTYLRKGEIASLLRRTDFLLERKTFPTPDPSRRQYPWPVI